MKSNKGFTLIELIMVIVIMGILAAVVVPRFFNLEVKAHEKVEASVIGSIRAGLMTYSMKELVDNGVKKFPPATDSLLKVILDEVPDGWRVGSTATSDSIIYEARGDVLVYWIYTCPGNNTSYDLSIKKTTPK